MFYLGQITHRSESESQICRIFKHSTALKRATRQSNWLRRNKLGSEVFGPLFGQVFAPNDVAMFETMQFGGEKPCVLVVEDNRLLRWCVRCGLARSGYDVCAPETVAEALQFQTAHSVNVVVTDMRLADGHSGVEVLQAVRRTHPHVRSVLMSADASLLENLRAYDVGFDWVIPKPFQLSEVISAVEALTARKESAAIE
ncbi:MAG TPA: response regulator [Candidatus Nitrosotenuis sp.]|nr:response regulator [Candidatus Nitrosotenuis sp.]